MADPTPLTTMPDMSRPVLLIPVPLRVTPRQCKARDE